MNAIELTNVLIMVILVAWSVANMCKMCLLVSSQNIKTNIDEVLFNDWSQSNKDGYGYFAIQKTKDPDKPYNFFLNRVQKTYANTRLKTINPKSLFILHCRAATEGKGNHPFISEDKYLMLVHNGIIHNYADYKKELVKAGHKFSTNVDSELMLHAYEQVANNDHSKYFNKDTVKAFIDKLSEKGISGWINLIFLCPLTLEWIAFSDGSLTVARPYNNLYTLIATEIDPLAKTTLLSKDLSDGEFIIGKGSDILAQDKTKTLFESFSFGEDYESWGSCGAIGYNHVAGKGYSKVTSKEDGYTYTLNEHGTWDKTKDSKIKEVDIFSEQARSFYAPHEIAFYIRECRLSCCELRGLGSRVHIGYAKCFNCNNTLQMLESEIGYRIPCCSKSCYIEIAQFIHMENYSIDEVLERVKASKSIRVNDIKNTIGETIKNNQIWLSKAERKDLKKLKKIKDQKVKFQEIVKFLNKHKLTAIKSATGETLFFRQDNKIENKGIKNTQGDTLMLEQNKESMVTGLHLCEKCKEIKTPDKMCSACTSEAMQNEYKRYRNSYL